MDVTVLLTSGINLESLTCRKEKSLLWSIMVISRLPITISQLV